MKINSKADIVQAVQRSYATLHAMGVKRMALFGSFVRDQANDQSDVDFIVEFSEGKKSFDAFMEVSFFLESLLGRKVELVTPSSMSPFLGPSIMSEAEDVLAAA